MLLSDVQHSDSDIDRQIDVEILIMIFDNHFPESSLEEYFTHSRVSLIVRDKTP